MKRLIGAMINELHSCETILEVGVGTGRLAEPLRKAGYELTGIDISARMIRKAKEKGIEQLVLADARFLPLLPIAFDATISVHVLHLIAEWKKMLQEICLVTRHSMFSVGQKCRNPVREAYGCLLEKYGYEQCRPGKSEQELGELVCPAKSLFIASYDVSADVSLTNLERRTSSSQWGISEDINLKIVQELRREFAAKTFRQDLCLLKWDMNLLRACCSTL
jgi:SAM-dependent methyltransferase